MPAIIAAVIGGTAAFGQDFLGSKAKKRQQKRYNKRFKGALNATESIRGRELAQREGLSRKATQELVGGYDAARREASRVGRAGKQGALDRATQLESSARQNLSDRGLGSLTSSITGPSRGINADLTRQTQGIDEGLAGLYGDLAMGRSQAQAGGSQQLAGLAAERGQLGANLAQMGTMGEFYGASPWGGGGQMPEIPNSLGQSWLTGLQTGTGIYGGMGGFGGGGGGGGGGGQGGGQMDLSWLFGGKPGSYGYGGQQQPNYFQGQSFVPGAY